MKPYFNWYYRKVLNAVFCAKRLLFSEKPGVVVQVRVSEVARWRGSEIPVNFKVKNKILI